MILPLITYGHPVLRTKAEPVGKVDKAIRELVKDMLETMAAKDGIGLAAQQVGKTLQICTIRIKPEQDVDESKGPRLNPGVAMPLVLMNPVILTKKGRHTFEEGCLSFPGIYAPVARVFEIKVSFLTLKGKPQQIEVKGLLAQAIQHELDHLNGILFVDRISLAKKIGLAGKLKRLKRQTAQEFGLV